MFVFDTGMVSPFSRDGKFIFTDHFRFELKNGRLEKDEETVVNGRYTSPYDERWSFYSSGIASYGQGIVQEFFTMEDRETAVFKSSRNEFLKGIESGSDTLIVSSLGLEGGLLAYDRSGVLKYEITSARGNPVMPRHGGDGFILAGSSGNEAFDKNRLGLILVRYNPRK